MPTPKTPDQATRLPGEGLVVTEGGVRVSPVVHQTGESAAREADRKRQLTEKIGAPAAPAVRVVQQLNG